MWSRSSIGEVVATGQSASLGPAGSRLPGFFLRAAKSRGMRRNTTIRRRSLQIVFHAEESAVNRFAAVRATLTKNDCDSYI